ncbi:MAG: hypothetical protein J5883_03745 [Clostridiales bacterium]|nr:hypothetical protein [Clostridiales bacterium]
MGYNLFSVNTVKDTYKKKLNEFMADLGPAIAKGKDITFADNDLTHTLELQHSRLEERNITAEYEYYSREDDPDKVFMASSWRDAHYESVVCTKSCGIKRTFTRDGKKLYSDNRKSMMYQTLSDVVEGPHPGSDSYCCPGCGAVSTIAELQNGCRFCGMQYKMSDLFPKVTAFYTLDDVGTNNKEFKSTVLKFILGATVILWVIFIIARLIQNDLTVGNIILGLIISIFFGAITGYFSYSFYLLGRLIVVGSRQSSGKWGTIGSRNKFEKAMKAVYPEFSFEYFTSKAISLIKNAIYSPDATKLLLYRGQPLDPSLSSIVDLNYGGALGVNAFKSENNMVTVWTDAFFDVLYDNGGKISLKRQVFRAVFKRRIDIPMDTNFSITRIQCPGCGSSFDALKDRKCPFCGNTYDLDFNDWALVNLELK